MSLYLVFGFLIASSVPLLELVKGDEEEPDFQFTVEPESRERDSTLDWYGQAESPDYGYWILTAWDGDDFVIRFTETADFIISSDFRRIRCHSHPGTPTETVRHLFLDQVLPRLLARPNQIVLHASGMVIGDQAIALLGASGRGKSTLAFSLCLQGHELITDDSLLLRTQGESVICVPSYPGLRLWPESLSGLCRDKAVTSWLAHYVNKRRLDAHQNGFAFATKTSTLRKIYLLDQSATDEISISPLAVCDVFKHLLDNSYALDVRDRERMRQEFNLLSWIMARVPISRLCYPRDFSRLPEVHRAIYSELE